MDRRALLIGTAALPLAGMSACQTVSTVASDATLIADGITNVLPTIESLVGISTAVVTKITSTVTAIKSAAAAVEGQVGGAAVSAATTIDGGVSDIVAALANFKLPAWVTNILQAAVTLAPVVMQEVGALVPLAPEPAAVNQARAILRAVA